MSTIDTFRKVSFFTKLTLLPFCFINKNSLFLKHFLFFFRKLNQADCLYYLFKQGPPPLDNCHTIKMLHWCIMIFPTFLQHKFPEILCWYFISKIDDIMEFTNRCLGQLNLRRMYIPNMLQYYVFIWKCTVYQCKLQECNKFKKFC